MALVLLLSLICWVFVDSGSSGSDQRTVSAVEGQTVSLPCEAKNQETIRVVEWTRLDLEEDQEVLFYRNGHFDPDNHPSYRNRVDLKDREMKDGDASLILKNVTFSDRGTFQCYIVHRGDTNKPESLSLVSLSVDPPPVDPAPVDPPGKQIEDPKPGRVGLPEAALVVVVVVVVVVGLVMFLRHMKKKSPPPPGSGPGPDEPLNDFDSETPTKV